VGRPRKLNSNACLFKFCFLIMFFKKVSCHSLFWLKQKKLNYKSNFSMYLFNLETLCSGFLPSDNFRLPKNTRSWTFWPVRHLWKISNNRDNVDQNLELTKYVDQYILIFFFCFDKLEFDLVSFYRANLKLVPKLCF